MYLCPPGEVGCHAARDAREPEADDLVDGVCLPAEVAGPGALRREEDVAQTLAHQRVAQEGAGAEGEQDDALVNWVWTK